MDRRSQVPLPDRHRCLDTEIVRVTATYPQGDSFPARLVTCRECGTRWLIDLDSRQRARVRGLRQSGDTRSPFQIAPDVLVLRREEATVASDAKNRLETQAVREEVLAFHAEYPEAKRDEILAHLEKAGFGNASYPVMTWIREARTAAEVAAIRGDDAQPQGEAAATESPAPAPAPKKAGIDTMSVPELRAHLLSHTTVPDSSWASRPEQVRPRNKGEKRADYIEAMLGKGGEA